MASEKSNEQPNVDEQAKYSLEQKTSISESRLDAANPELYMAPGQKSGMKLSSDVIEKHLAQSKAVQKLMESTEKLLRPVVAFQNMMGVTQKMLLPSLEIQAFLKATDRALQPSRQLQEMVAQSETITRTFSQYGAAPVGVLDKALQQSQSFKAMIASMDVHSSSASLKSVLGSFDQLRISPLFDLLSSAGHSKIQTLLDAYDGEEASPDLSTVASSSEEVEAEVVRALEANGSPQKLTAPAMALLLLLLTLLYQSYDNIAKWNDFRESVCDAERRLGVLDSLAQARKVARSELCGMPQTLRNSIRLTKKDAVNLRQGPGMKEDVILSLPKFAPLEVIDFSNRDWLLVVYKHEGIEIEGWVSRKYVRGISK